MFELGTSNLTIRDRLIASGVILIVAAISRFLYDNRSQIYAASKEDKLASSNSFKYVYPYLQYSTIVACLGGCWFHDKIFLDIHDNVVLLYVGIAFTIAATSLFVRSKLSLGSNYSPCFDVYTPHSLTSHGLYARIRHPIYSSNMLLLFGAFLMSGSLWIILNLGVVMLYYYKAAVREEQELSVLFADYESYVEKTGRFFPRLHDR